ncbi:MAG: hypothetical protein ACKOX6_06990 [Bdellovibrio sp.]
MLKSLVFLTFLLLLTQGGWAAPARKKSPVNNTQKAAVAAKTSAKASAKKKLTSKITSQVSPTKTSSVVIAPVQKPLPPKPFKATYAGLTAPSATLSAVRADTKVEPHYTNVLQMGTVFKTLTASTQGAGNNHDVVLEPNTPMGFSLGWSSRPLGISLTGNIANGARNSEKVNTSAEDYQLRYFSSKVGIELIYQRYTGFDQHAANTSGGPFVDPSEVKQGDMSMTMLQAQFDWAFYGVGILESFGPAWEKPQKDGAAYYVTSSLSQAEISSPKPFLPADATADYGNDATLTEGKYQTFGVGLGASYVWQWTRFYVGVFGSIQGGPQKQTYKTTTMEWDNLKYVWFPQAKLVIGYDWGTWYINAIGHTHRVSVDLKDTDLAFFSQDGGIYVGSRF